MKCDYQEHEIGKEEEDVWREEEGGRDLVDAEVTSGGRCRRCWGVAYGWSRDTGLTRSSLSDAVFVGRKDKERESKVKVR